jgi:hypothetical protein
MTTTGWFGSEATICTLVISFCAKPESTTASFCEVTFSFVITGQAANGKRFVVFHREGIFLGITILGTLGVARVAFAGVVGGGR